MISSIDYKNSLSTVLCNYSVILEHCHMVSQYSSPPQIYVKFIRLVLDPHEFVAKK